MRKIARLFAAALLLGLSPGLAVAQMRQQVPDRLGVIYRITVMWKQGDLTSYFTMQRSAARRS